MRVFFAFGLPVIGILCLAMPAAPAQFGGRTNALGGSVGSRGAMSHPLGGFSAPLPGVRGNRGYSAPNGARRGDRFGDRGAYGYPYASSFYVPNYFGDYYDQGGYDAPYGDPYASAPPPVGAYAAPAPAPQQPVIINQYFGVQPPSPDNGPPSVARDTQAPGSPILGAPLGNTENYYLIAYKDHAVYAALAYWVEDKTLHYVTTQNTHNQAALDLIDLNLTKSLNQSREVPFAIPGQ